jgi:hypothetical protein
MVLMGALFADDDLLQGVMEVLTGISRKGLEADFEEWRTCSDAIITSGEDGQMPVALKACSQLLIVAVRPHASTIAETRRYLAAASSLCPSNAVITGLRILAGSV